MAAQPEIVLSCDECQASNRFRTGAHARGWLTLWLHGGVPLFDISSGPRGMRDELDNIERRSVHLCPTCSNKLRVYLRSFLSRAIGSTAPHLLDDPGDLSLPAVTDDDEIPF